MDGFGSGMGAWDDLEMDMFLSRFLDQGQGQGQAQELGYAQGDGSSSQGKPRFEDESREWQGEEQLDNLTQPEPNTYDGDDSKFEIDSQEDIVAYNENLAGNYEDSHTGILEAHSARSSSKRPISEAEAAEQFIYESTRRKSSSIDDSCVESLTRRDYEPALSLKRPLLQAVPERATRIKTEHVQEHTEVKDTAGIPYIHSESMSDDSVHGPSSPDPHMYMYDSAGEPQWDGKEKKVKAREHARNTRKRRKNFITSLEHQAKSLAYAFKLHCERQITALQKVKEKRDHMFQICKQFLDLRYQACEDANEWDAIVEPDVVIGLPFSPFQYHAHCQVHNGKWSLYGTSALISESSSLSILLSSFDRQSAECDDRLALNLTMEDEFVTRNNLLMGSWNLQSMNSVMCGGKQEISHRGMINATFSESGKIAFAELFFDAQKLRALLEESVGLNCPNCPSSPEEVQVHSRVEHRVLTSLGPSFRILNSSESFAEAVGVSVEQLCGQTLTLNDSIELSTLQQWRPIKTPDPASLCLEGTKCVPCVRWSRIHLLPLTSSASIGFLTTQTRNLNLTDVRTPTADLVMWQMFTSPEDELQQVVQFIQRFLNAVLAMFPQDTESGCVVLKEVLDTVYQIATARITDRRDMFKLCSSFWSLSKTVTHRHKQMSALQSHEQRLLPLSRQSIAQGLKDAYTAAAENCLGIGGMSVGTIDGCVQSTGKEDDKISGFTDQDVDGKARHSFQSEDEAMALERLCKAFEMFFVDMRTSSMMSRIFLLLRQATNKNTARVLEEIIWACSSNHTNPRIKELLNLGRMHTDNRNFKEAITVYSQILQLDPSLTDVYNRRANAFYSEGDYLQSLRDIQFVLSREPNHYGALCGRGLALMKMQQYEQARTSFKRALAINPWIANDSSSSTIPANVPP